MLKITEETRIAISLQALFAALSVIVIGVATGAFWVSRVDDRLSRIEDKLGIPRDASSTWLVPEARASIDKHKESVHPDSHKEK